MALNLKIITPDGIFFDGIIETVNVKTTEGYISIFEWHTPIIANITISQMMFRTSERTRQLSVAGGLLITNSHEVRIISDKIDYTSNLKEQEENINKARMKKVSSSIG